MADDLGADFRSTALAFGFALIAAALAGGLVERLRLPRISGYLLFGLLCGPQAADLISRVMATDLQLVNGLAVALIAFIAGLEVNLSRIRDRLRTIAVVGASVIGVTSALLAVAIYWAWPWLPIAPEASGLSRLAMTLVLTTVLVSFSPTVTIAVIAESRARGPLSELALSVVVLADLVLILAFALAMQFTRTATGAGSAEIVGLLPFLSWEIFGSLAFGATIGALFAFYLGHVSRELTLVLLALCITVSAAGAVWHLEPLLAALAAGMVVENIAPPRGDALKDAVERGSLPVLIVFFATAGASIDLRALAATAPIALAIAIGRAGAIWAGAALGGRAARLPPASAALVWMGLVSQAGVTLGLATIVAREFPDWGRAVQSLVLALTGLHVLVGPVLLRAALARAGEIGAAEPAPEAQLNARNGFARAAGLPD
jgi:Kef-type K+ transport system membrane component KefB